MSEDGFRDPPDTADGGVPMAEQIAPNKPETDVPLPDGAVRYKLLTPISVPGKVGMTTITEIVCRRPTGADMLACGNPVHFDPGSGRIDHDVNRMPSMIYRLSGIPDPFLGKMTTQDLTGLFWTITHFFLPPMGAI